MNANQIIFLAVMCGFSWTAGAYLGPMTKLIMSLTQ